MRRRLIALFGVGTLALGGASAGPGAGAAREWQRAAPLPVPRSEVAAATVGRQLIVAGGFRADGRSSARVDAYSPGSNRWRRLPDLPVAVNHAMAASDGRRLYVVGGYGAPTRAFVLSRGRWRRLPNLPVPRAAAGAAIVGSTLYVVGGVARGGLAQHALAFDRTRRRWTQIPGPKPREHLGVSALGGRLYAVAGREAGTNFDTFQAYLPARRRWVSYRGFRRHAVGRTPPRSARCSFRRGASRQRGRQRPSTRSMFAAVGGGACPTCLRQGTGSACSAWAAVST
jgi:hypothetical protein